MKCPRLKRPTVTRPIRRKLPAAARARLLGAGRRPSRWPPASAISRSASFLPRTATCWASTIPRKALLTTVKEAVDNSLDACEEAGILPEIWVHIEADRRQPLQSRRPGQRAGHPQEADPADLRQAALRLEVPSPADEPRPARHRHQRGRHVRRADDRQAGEDHLQSLAAQAGPLLRDPDRHQEEQARDSQRQRRGRRHSARRRGAQIHRQARHRVDRAGPRHAGDDRARGPLSPRPRQRRRISRANGDRQPARHAALRRPRGARARLSALGRRACPPSRRRSSRIPTASSWACW